MSERIGTKMLPRAATPLNPRLHDEFVALCALYFSGEISEEEWALLQIHMAYCDSCQDHFLQYQRITDDLIPAMAAVAASERDKTQGETAESMDTAEERLMSRIHSRSTHEEPKRGSNIRGYLPIALVAACALAAVCLWLSLYSFRTKVASIPPGGVPNAVPVTPNTSNREVELALESAQQQAAALKEQAVDSERRLRESDQNVTELEKKLEDEEAAQKELKDEKIALAQQLAAAQTELASVRNKWEVAGTDAAEKSAKTTALENQVRELRAALDDKDVLLSEKDRMLALDKDFLSRDRDIRDLIGARNLYIADILDTNENGRTAKQFGRIFYTKDRSLVFYGFDLDEQASHNQNVSFQVWGSGSDRPKPVSLGLFYQDDNHKRWVLRCNDAKTLARLDMVFVTIEPPGGSPKPTGKRLLRAYLQIQPNHP